MRIYEVKVFFHDDYIPTGQYIKANSNEEANMQLRWMYPGVDLKQLNRMYILEQHLSISQDSEEL